MAAELRERFKSMAFEPDSHEKYIKKCNENEVNELTDQLKELNITSCDTPTALPLPGEHADATIDVRTNMYEVTNIEAKTIYKYRIEIIGIKRGRCDDGSVGDQNVYFTSDGSDEFLTIERHDVCARVFEHLTEHDVNFQGRRFFYDFASKLYSTHDLGDKEIIVDIKRMSDYAQFDEDAALRAAFRMVGGLRVTVVRDGQVDSNLARVAENATFEDISPEIVHFLDVASSAEHVKRTYEFTVYNINKIYYMHPRDYCHRESNLDLGTFGVTIWAGLAKTHRILDSGKAAIVIQPKLSPFHTPQMASEKLLAMKKAQINIGTRRNMLCGVYVYPLHLFNGRSDVPSRRAYVVKIIDIAEPPRHQYFPYKDRNTGEIRQISVSDYFKEVHGIILQHPTLPSLKCRQGREMNKDGKWTARINYYPAEVCQILDYQRLKPCALSCELVSKLVEVACMTPYHLRTRTKKCVDALNLSRSQAFRDATFSAEEEPMVLKVPRLAPPQMCYGENHVENYNPMTTQWSSETTRYQRASPPLAWVFYQAVRGFHIPPLLDDRKFVAELIKCARSRGMQLGEPSEHLDLCPESTLKKSYFEHCEPLLLKMKDIEDMAKEGQVAVHLIMLITSEEDKNIHYALKAYERQIGIVTQNVLVQTAFEAIGQNDQNKPNRQIMENIVNKMNMKLGGLNYKLVQSNKQPALSTSDLIVGFKIDLVSGALGLGDYSNQHAPTVLGFAANDGREPEEFFGDHLFQKPTTIADLPTMKRGFDTICDRYVKHRGCAPERVIFYQLGITENQHANVLRFYVPLLRSRMSAKFGSTTTLTYIVCSRQHNLRFMPTKFNIRGEAEEQNLPAGVVIDKEIVRPNVSEFFLSSHRASKGTTLMPRYSVLFNNNPQMTMVEIEKLSYTLAFGHQIINQPIGIPAPLFIAKRYAERGRLLFMAPSNYYHLARCYGGEPGTASSTCDWEKVTNALSLELKSDLRSRRINA